MRETIRCAGSYLVDALESDDADAWSFFNELTSHHRSSLRNIEAATWAVRRCKLTIGHAWLSRATGYWETTLRR